MHSLARAFFGNRAPKNVAFIHDRYTTPAAVVLSSLNEFLMPLDATSCSKCRASDLELPQLQPDVSSSFDRNEKHFMCDQSKAQAVQLQAMLTTEDRARGLRSFRQIDAGCGSRRWHQQRLQ